MRNDEDRLLTNHFLDLYHRAFGSSSYAFSSFLSLSESSCLRGMIQSGQIPRDFVKLYGGYDEAERLIARFGSPEEFGWEEEFPVSVILIAPLQDKFSEELTHRDFLGALLNLGIDRNTLGDIRISGHSAYVYALSRICGHILEHLTRIRHTTVSCRITDRAEEEIVPSFETKELILPSERIDVLISRLINVSRSQVLSLFRSGRVFVNGREVSSNSTMVRSADVLSIRGFGKFIYDGILRSTRKDHLVVQVRKYL